jgi:hypothetical protein
MEVPEATHPHTSSDSQTSNPAIHRADWLVSLGVGLFSLVVYLLTLTPSLSYLSADGSELATIPYVLGLAHSPGYPVYTWIGFLFSRLLPFGDVAYRVNLMSAVFASIGVGGLYLAIIQLLPVSWVTRKRADTTNGETPTPDSIWFKRAIAVSAAALFAFSVDFWSQALIAEVYAPNIGFLAITLLLLLAWSRTHKPWHYFTFALVFGLSLGTHISNLGFAPAFALFTILALIPPDSKGHAEREDRVPTTRISRFLSWSKKLLVTSLSGAIGFLLGIAQFAWLPLRASTLNDRFMLRNAPKTLKGLYNYTLGAFPNFKFAFPLTALPERLVIYLDLLRDQFGYLGIALGIVGLFALLYRRPRHFYLVLGMYLVNVWFFIQYNAFDLEVFFIPAHFTWAILMAFGIWGILWAAPRLAQRWAPGLLTKTGIRITLKTVASTGVLFLCVPLLLNNWERNDFSEDTAINDFYANTWGLLPQDAALITPGGVFGYDAFYWKLVYGTRPDVILPTLPTPNPSKAALAGREVYATTRALQANRGPGALPPDLVDQDLWAIPVLLGEQPDYTTWKRQPPILYHLKATPPEITISDPVIPIERNADLGFAQLLGVEIIPSIVESGGSIHIKLYWVLKPGTRPPRVAISLGERTLAQYEVGFGNLVRYHQTLGIKPGDTILDEYHLVIPSNIPEGEWDLNVSAVGLGDHHQNPVTLTQLTVINQSGKFDAWLQAAGDHQE